MAAGAQSHAQNGIRPQTQDAIPEIANAVITTCRAQIKLIGSSAHRNEAIQHRIFCASCTTLNQHVYPTLWRYTISKNVSLIGPDYGFKPVMAFGVPARHFAMACSDRVLDLNSKEHHNDAHGRNCKINQVFCFFRLTLKAIRCLKEFFRVQVFLWRGFFGQKSQNQARGWFRNIRQAVSIRLNP